MGHDYIPSMSAALDGRLNTDELARWNAHRATCSHCQQRWQAFQDVDRRLSHAPRMAPAPGFTARFSTRLAKQQSTYRVQRQTWIGAGLLAVGVILISLALILPLAGNLPMLGQAINRLPAQVYTVVRYLAQWVVILRAMSEVGRALAGFVMPWAVGLALIYAGVLAAAWSGMAWQISRYGTNAMAMRRA